jgi:hypothetical protein
MIATHRRLFGVLVASSTLLIAACGSPGPLKLSLVTTQASSGVNRALEGAIDTSKDAVYAEWQYEPAADLSIDRISGFAWSVLQKNDTKGSFRAIAGALQLNGDLVKQDKNTFTIGVPKNDDPTVQPTGAQMYLFVNTTGAWWSYSAGAMSAGSSPPCDPGVADCVSPAPAVSANLLSERDALNRTISTLTTGGYNTATFTFTATTTQWSTDVVGVLNIAGVPSNMTVSFSYGANGLLNSANGPLVYVKRANGYYMISPTEAVKRLQDPRYTSWGNATDAVVSNSVSSPDTGTEASRIIPITGVRYVLMQSRLTAETSILLPAYTFTNDAGEVGTVIAIEDKYLVFGNSAVPSGSTIVVPGTDTAPPEPIGTIEPDLPIMNPIDDAAAKQLVGLTEGEATKVATGNGWTIRIAMRDGESFMLTTDFQDNRVNFTVENGVVTAVTVG